MSAGKVPKNPEIVTQNEDGSVTTHSFKVTDDALVVSIHTVFRIKSDTEENDVVTYYESAAEFTTVIEITGNLVIKITKSYKSPQKTIETIEEFGRRMHPTMHKSATVNTNFWVIELRRGAMLVKLSNRKVVFNTGAEKLQPLIEAAVAVCNGGVDDEYIIFDKVNELAMFLFTSQLHRNGGNDWLKLQI